MNIRAFGAPALALALALSTGIAHADTLSVSCAGSAATSTITWTATASDGVAPYTYLWGTGTSTNPLTPSYAPGTYTMTIQATDASSSVATSTCAATVAQPATTTPPTGSGIAAQIQALLQQIQLLQEQIRRLVASQVGSITNATTTPPMNPGQIGKAMCIELNHDLKEGDDGDDVRSLQDFLASDPRFGFTASSTGFFGPMTAHAVMRFQELEGVSSSSAPRVGPLTREFFHRHCGKGLIEREHGRGDNATSTEDATSSDGHGPLQGLIQNLRIFNGGDDHGNNGNNGGSGNDHGDGHPNGRE